MHTREVIAAIEMRSLWTYQPREVSSCAFVTDPAHLPNSPPVPTSGTPSSAFCYSSLHFLGLYANRTKQCAGAGVGLVSLSRVLILSLVHVITCPGSSVPLVAE